MVTLDELPRLVHDGEADTVVMAFKDMQGRLRGKGVHAAFLVDEQGRVASAAFGGLVVDHYLDDARTEQRLFDAVVTCYERQRLFERI